MQAEHGSFSPFIHISSVPNFRDIGGWPTESLSPSTPSTKPTSQKRVRPCLIYRSADTLRITADDSGKLQELNIKTVFDLRSKQQVEKLGIKDLSEWEIKRVWAPVFSEEEYGEENARKRYEQYASEDVKVKAAANDAYALIKVFANISLRMQDIVEAFVEILIAGAGMMRVVLRHLLSTSTECEDKAQPPALLMHCTTGNNRTGVFVAMLLSLLGVPTEQVVYEYTLSDQGLAPTRQVNIERLLKKGVFQDYGPEEARRKCERMVSARAESMEALLKETDERWGGAEGYFKNVVLLEEEEIRRVRELLVC